MKFRNIFFIIIKIPKYFQKKNIAEHLKTYRMAYIKYLKKFLNTVEYFLFKIIRKIKL